LVLARLVRIRGVVFRMVAAHSKLSSPARPGPVASALD
jgi:hypothetical protein